jgi:outer membrane protein assembly factor BamB
VDGSGEHVFLGSPTHALALSPETGKLIWETRLPWPSVPVTATYRPYPTGLGNLVIFYSELGRIACLDADDGTLVWSRDLLGYELKPGVPLIDGEDLVLLLMQAPMVQVHDGRLFFALGALGDEVFALDIWTGETLWRSKIDDLPGLELSRSMYPTFCQPVIWGSVLVVALRDEFAVGPAILVALDVKTGAVVWGYAPPQIAKCVWQPAPNMNGIDTRWAQVSSNLLVVGDELLFCTHDGMLRALASDALGERWQLRLAPQSRASDFGATLHQVGSQVVAFNGAKAWWIDVPSGGGE